VGRGVATAEAAAGGAPPVETGREVCAGAARTGSGGTWVGGIAGTPERAGREDARVADVADDNGEVGARQESNGRFLAVPDDLAARADWPATDKLALTWLRRTVRWEGTDGAIPCGKRRLGRAVGVSDRTARMILRRLERKGEISVEAVGGKGHRAADGRLLPRGGRASVIRVHTPGTKLPRARGRYFQTSGEESTPQAGKKVPRFSGSSTRCTTRKKRRGGPAPGRPPRRGNGDGNGNASERLYRGPGHDLGELLTAVRCELPAATADAVRQAAEVLDQRRIALTCGNIVEYLRREPAAGESAGPRRAKAQQTAVL